MKKTFFKTGLVLVIALLAMSCSKDEIVNQDARDQYVGTWSSTSSGSLTLYQNGQSVGTVPINETATVTITKSGSNALLIDGSSYIVNGNILSSNPAPVNENSNGVNIVGTAISNGNLGSNIIILNDAITGTWNATNGATGNLSGTVIRTLTK